MSLSILALGDCYFAKINISAFCDFFMPIIYYLNKFLTHAHYGIGRRKSWVWQIYSEEISSDENTPWVLLKIYSNYAIIFFQKGI